MKSQWLLVAVFFPLEILSQENSTRLHLHTIVSVGMARGESTVKPLVQIESGIFRQRWFGGAGIGIDLYNLKSIPLFLAGRLHLGKRRQLFVYGNGGYNFPVGNKSNFVDAWQSTNRFYGGFYMDAGLGYRVRVNSLHHIIVSAGFSEKNVVNKVRYKYFFPGSPSQEIIDKYDYKMRRVVARLSWDFGK